MANQISAKLERAASLLVLTFIAAFAASTAQALPRPTAASYARGAQFEVAGYDASKPALSGFPVLVRIANDSPSGFDYSQLQSPSDGADLCFIDMDGNGLPFEIDTWNTNGTSLVWVTLPTMEQGTQFVMCWGGATSGKTVCGTNPFAGYKGVWHMNSVDPADSSPNGYNGTHRTGNLSVVEGAVGAAVNVPRTSTSDGSTCGEVLPNSELVDGFTIEGWCRPTQYGGMSDGAAMFGKKDIVSLRIKDAKTVILTTPTVDNHTVSLESGVLPAVNEWWHFVATFVMSTSGGFNFYVNGQLVKTLDSKGIKNKTDATEMFLGNNQWNQAFKGDLDEIRLSAGLQSTNWIAATYATQSDPAFLTAGAAQTYEVTAAPQVGLSVQSSAVLYTNATLTATIGSLGKNEQMTADASWVDPLLVVSANSDLSTPLFSIPLSRVSTAPVSVPVAILPLVTNTTYYAQVLATNSFDVAGESSVISFTTRTPGAPAGTAMFMERGFSTMAATATVTSFGAGGESANVRLEASTDDFETVVAGEELPTVLDASTQLSVTNLAADTMYSLRVRIRNDWGLDTYLPLPDIYTRAVPFATTGIGWQFSQDGSTIDITFGISGIYEGAEGTATLTYDGVEVGSQSVTGPGPLSWPGITAASGTATATVILSATLNNQPYTQTFTASIALGSTVVTVPDFANHQATTNAVLVHAGDVITLPELSGSASYSVGNKLFGSLEGNVLTALRPGILGVHCFGNDGSTNTLPVVILPEVGGSGEIYLFDETCTGNNTFQWAAARPWKKISGESENQWPQNQDDVAIFALFNQASGAGMVIDMKNLAVSVGAMYVGHFRDRASSFGTREQSGGTGSRISLVRTDGEPAVMQLCPNTLSSARVAEFKFNGNLKNVSYLSNTTISGGWDGTNSEYPRGRITFSDATTNSIPADVTVELVEMDTKSVNYNSGTISIGNLSGAGTFWNHSCGLVKYGSGSSGFTGLIRDSGGHNAGGESQGRSGPAYVRTSTLSNACAEVVGWVGSGGQDPQWDYRKGCGALYTGYPHTHEVDSPHLPYFTARGVTMHGGLIVNRFIQSTAWTNSAVNSITRDTKRTDFLDVACGFNYIYADEKSSSNPGNDFIAGEIRNGGKATLRITDPSRYSLASTATATNVMNVLHGISAYAVGAGGNCETTAAYSIVPWIVAPVAQNDQNTMLFACFDEADRLVRPAYESQSIESFGDTDNAIVWTKDKNSIALAADKTLNSLVLDNSGLHSQDKRLGTGRTLTLTSGGLVFSGSGAVIGTEDGGSKNGALVLGDAEHSAYVWARGAVSSPNQIWAPVTAPGGFVAAYTGNLVLGGDQTGIRDEIAVNAGTLQLGTAESTCSLATELPIRIFANATLKLPNDSSVTGNIVKFDGAAGWFGKVEVPAGVAAKCRRVYWRDYPETQEWQVLKRGIYGSSESGAPNIRDDLFVGAGTLQVLRDDSAMPFFIMVR